MLKHIKLRPIIDNINIKPSFHPPEGELKHKWVHDFFFFY